MISEYDVIVIGLGPAGAAATTHLSKNGLRVCAIDKMSFPRDKTCGDGLTTSSLRQLETLGIDPRKLSSWRLITDTYWRAPSGYVTHLQVPSDGIRVGVAQRMELDNLLFARAQACDATVKTQCAITDLRSSNTGIEITTSSGERLSSQYVIAADGMWSATRKLCGEHDAQKYLGDIHAFRQYFTNVSGIAANAMWVSFERDILPGYVWAFPCGNNGANVGFGVLRGNQRSVQWMKQKWQEILSRPHVIAALGEHAQPLETQKAWPIPASIHPRRLVAASGRILFVGDAARVVDPLTGEGIGQAMHTAELATNALAAAKKRGDFSSSMRVARTYQRDVATGLMIDNAFAKVLSRIASHSVGVELAIRLAPRGPQHGRYAVRWAFEDNPRAGLLTPWRWKTRFQPKHGAFYIP